MTERLFELVVFDWDGTLVDSTAPITTAVLATLEELGWEAVAPEEARALIGLGLDDAVRALRPQADTADLKRFTDTYRGHFLARTGGGAALFPGVDETLAALAGDGCLLSIATGKGRRGLDRELAATGIGHRFAASRCADECFSKPHPQMLLELLELLDVEPRSAVMVGDTEFDLEMASAAGMPAVAVSYGAHPLSRLEAASPDALIDDIRRLPECLKRLARAGAGISRAG